jgi:putative DNA primase/helicase
MSEELEGLASHIIAFAAECCVLGPEREIEVDMLYVYWRGWCERRGIRYFLEQNHFSQKLRAAFPTVTKGRPRRGKSGRPTWLRGIGIRAN